MTLDQKACNIAGYMSTTIIKAAMQQQLDSLSSSQNAFDSLQTYIADVSPGGSGVASTVVSFFLAAFLNEMNTMFSEGTSTYEDAVADTDLWDDVTCAIYEAIKADGSPNAENFGDIAGNITDISYSPATVPETIAQYVLDLGLDGVLQTIQGSVFAALDCTECDEPPPGVITDFQYKNSTTGENLPNHWTYVGSNTYVFDVLVQPGDTNTYAYVFRSSGDGFAVTSATLSGGSGGPRQHYPYPSGAVINNLDPGDWLGFYVAIPGTTTRQLTIVCTPI